MWKPAWIPPPHIGGEPIGNRFVRLHSWIIYENQPWTNFGMALLSLLVALDLWYHWRYLCPHIIKRNTLTNWFYDKIMNIFLHSLNVRLQRPFMEEVRPDFSGKWRNLEKFPRSCFKWDISDYNDGGRVPCERRPPINNRHWPRCVWSLCFSHISERSYNHASHAWWST